MTPGNIRSSGALDNDNKPQLTVDMKWESRASVVANGWIAEMAIPLRILAFQGSDRVIMSFKVARFISRKAEEENLPEMKPDERNFDHYRESSYATLSRRRCPPPKFTGRGWRI